MTDPAPLSDVLADEALLDRLGARADTGSDATSDPVAGVLASLAALSEAPIGPTRSAQPARHRRPSRTRRSVAVAGLLAVALSGAGVAAAMTLPDLAGPTPTPVPASRSAKPPKPAVPQQAGRLGSKQSTPTRTPGSGTTRSTTPSVTSTVPPSAIPTAASRTAPGAGDTRGPATNAKRGAIPPTPARDGRPPGLVSGPGAPAATVPPQAAHGQQQGRSGRTSPPTTPASQAPTTE